MPATLPLDNRLECVTVALTLYFKSIIFLPSYKLAVLLAKSAHLNYNNSDNVSDVLHVFLVYTKYFT